MMSDLFRLSNYAWSAIEPHLPKNQPGARRVDDRRVISGILHVLKIGCRWRHVPAEYGPAKTVYNRYHRWARRRIWHRIFEKMAASGKVPQELSIEKPNAPPNFIDLFIIKVSGVCGTYDQRAGWLSWKE